MCVYSEIAYHAVCVLFKVILLLLLLYCSLVIRATALPAMQRFC